MNQKVEVLVISPNKGLIESVSEGVLAFGNSVQVIHKKSGSEAFEFIDKLGRDFDNLQIYLDCKSSKINAQSFVQRLDRDMNKISRRSVILADDASSITGLVSLAMAECVGNVLNYPILPTEVETTMRKRFPQLQATLQA